MDRSSIHLLPLPYFHCSFPPTEQNMWVLQTFESQQIFALCLLLNESLLTDLRVLCFGQVSKTGRIMTTNDRQATKIKLQDSYDLSVLLTCVVCFISYSQSQVKLFSLPSHSCFFLFSNMKRKHKSFFWNTGLQNVSAAHINGGNSS